ncbi:hypothetical protein MTX78_21475 [Hymenobacter tibetensis]|uniref:Uncharacterized protein n=1 Tax=Hymenobacter tibetensis TaxID=497967 RepID=A0ABY4CWM7_9BACT|nr:hypothetical protein [Hymenobacter tibetensis]UOG74676.1 hypothetical protein MTX78_21475 [Hymenobacter tibetensis]
MKYLLCLWVALTACSAPARDIKGYKYRLSVTTSNFKLASYRDTVKLVMSVDAANSDRLTSYTWVAPYSVENSDGLQNSAGILAASAADSVFYYVQQIFSQIPITSGNTLIPSITDGPETKIDVVTEADSHATITFSNAAIPSAYYKLLRLMERQPIEGQ